MRWIGLILNLGLAALCLVGGALVRVPFASGGRSFLVFAVIAIAGAVAAFAWRGRSDRLSLAPLGIAFAALAVMFAIETSFQFARWTVLSADSAMIERVGRHIVVGYTDPAVVRGLVERRAIGGIFITRRNVAGKDADAIAREIAELQKIRTRQGLPPLWVATDQEGGGVSRMSPPLAQQPALASAVGGLTDARARREAVTSYASQQGRGLAGLGINLNFAPVVDLDFGVHNPRDAFTRISERAIAADPNLVSEVAGWYCDGLVAQGVRCTLKHFPGLGRVFEDTHRSEGALSASRDELERADWVPFRRLLGRSQSLVMVGHVRLPVLDGANPVSTSRLAINGLLRSEWGYDGLVITDDMCMGAITFGRDGIGQASVRALEAGVDLLLVSWDGEQIYPVLAALLQAQARPDFAATLKRSADRLRAAQSMLLGAAR